MKPELQLQSGTDVGGPGFLWPIFQFPALQPAEEEEVQLENPENPQMGAVLPARSKSRAVSLDNKNNRLESKWSGFLPETSGKEQPSCLKKNKLQVPGTGRGGGVAVPTTQEPLCSTVLQLCSERRGRVFLGQLVTWSDPLPPPSTVITYSVSWAY